MKQNFNYTKESGRTMGEILAVLALIGILSVGAWAAYTHAINKEKANRIIYDGRLVYTAALSQKENKKTWQPSGLLHESKKTFSYLIDAVDHPYVKVESVEEKVCRILLTFSGERVHFYTPENETFTKCDTTNDIVIDYDNKGPMAECASYSDCEGAEDAYCSDGQCGHCEEGRDLKEDRSGCTCIEGLELTCTDAENNEWCCGFNEEGQPTICGSTKGECLVGDGQCRYTMTQQTQTRAANCSYRMTQQTQTRAANCSYTMTQQTQTRAANCIYEFSGTEDNVSLTEIQGCPEANQYCYLAHADAGCVNTLKPEATGIMYGTCLRQTSASSQCNISAVTEALAPLQTCPEADQYCYLAYGDKDCDNALAADATGIMYGTCLRQTSASSQCNISAVTEALEPIRTCPEADQYCYLAYEDEECDTALSADATGIMYGTCLRQTSASSQCNISAITEALEPVQGCPASQYCHFK